MRRGSAHALPAEPQPSAHHWQHQARLHGQLSREVLEGRTQAAQALRYRLGPGGEVDVSMEVQAVPEQHRVAAPGPWSVCVGGGAGGAAACRWLCKLMQCVTARWLTRHTRTW